MKGQFSSGRAEDAAGNRVRDVQERQHGQGRVRLLPAFDGGVLVSTSDVIDEQVRTISLTRGDGIHRGSFHSSHPDVPGSILTSDCW